MLQVKDLTIVHKKDLTTLVEGLSFQVAPGDRAALIGEEGNGKSTLLKLLWNRELVEDYAEWTGSLGDESLRRGYLAQELTAEELALPVAVFCERTPAFEETAPRELARTAAQVGLDRALFYDWREMGTLSGGERVKLRLALLLLEQPEVLLLDEPSNDLDLEALEWLESFLRACPAAVLYVSHDERLLENTANVMIHLERLSRRTTPRCTVKRCGYREYVEGRAAAFAVQEKRARKEREAYGKKLERWRDIHNAVEHAQGAVSRQNPGQGRLLKKKMHTVLAMGRRFEREREAMTQLPQWEQTILTAFDQEAAAFPAGKAVLRLELPRLAVEERVLAREVRLWVTGPEKIGIVGPNGAGKSTLLKVAAEELLARRDIRAAYMPQDYGEGLTGAQTPVELLAPSGRREDVTRARTLLGSMQYKAEEMEHPVRDLSGGQRAKLLFLAMVLRRPNVLVLDEPTRNFSPASAPVVRQALAGFPGCVISVSHDRLYLEQVCTRILELGPEGLTERRLD